MHESGYTADKPYRKSARVVGEVMGKYHPHGDASIYDALVRMAQPFSMRVPLIDGQGNFGSVDGDPPAAMRYTEVAAGALGAPSCWTTSTRTRSISSRTTTRASEEPRVLPARYPNLLVNGANGIAVGMATNIPPHNPGEIIDATLALIEQPGRSTLDELMQIVPGPDFPTGGMILGRAGIRAAFETGRGSLVVRAKAEFEEMRGGRQAIVVTEIPYQVNKNDAAGEDRRAGPRQADRGHLRHARRERPRRHADRDRAEARRDAGGGAEPPVPVHRSCRRASASTSWRWTAAGRG